MNVRTYASAQAFKQVLEQRIRDACRAGEEMARKRQKLVFDRFLARVTAVLGDAVTLKGGLVLELRLARARATQDIDLRLIGAPDSVTESLRAAARLDLGDFMAFEVEADEAHPEIQAEEMIYGGLRFRGECLLAGKIYGQRFGIDIGFADPLIAEPDLALLGTVRAVDARILRAAAPLQQQRPTRAEASGGRSLTALGATYFNLEPLKSNRLVYRGIRTPRRARWPASPRS